MEKSSAMGTVLLGRNRETQGILPIRGKIINAFKCTKAKFFDNEEVQAITRIILGRDYVRNFDVKDAKVSKIIFMTDADFDGYHIASLLERMFIMYFPQFIEAGMVYKAVPPLYAAKIGGKEKYFTEQKDMTRYIQKIFCQKYVLKSLSKELLTNNEITDFFMINIDYQYHLERISNMYALNPYLLEIVLFNYISNNGKFNYTKLGKEISNKYRFMNTSKENDTIIIKGVIEKSNILIANNKFIFDCKNILDIMTQNKSLYYFVNDNKMSIYEIMLLYTASTPNNIERYKGLGEMSKDALAESTLYPGSNRTLIRYTTEDIKDAFNSIREYESDTKKILNLVGKVSRDDLID